MPYARAPLPPEPWFVDADGVRFQYGTRHFFDDGSPIDAAYSRDGHPERFAPVHAAADRLVEWLVSEYDVVVVVDDDVADAVAARRLGDIVVCGVRVTPRSPEAAPLVVLWTSYPGVIVLAGTMLMTPTPVCGCDACDETAATAVQQLEDTVQAVVSGGLKERLHGAAGLLEVTGPGWSSTAQAEPWTGADKASEVLGRLRDGQWQPWPPARGGRT